MAEAVSAERAANEIALPKGRLNSIDMLRGVAIVVMALDHTRDFFGASAQSPRDITDPALFMTRWVTHFCAPTFILLAGLSAFLYGARGRSLGDVSRFLLTRGLWIIFVEFTIVGFGWNLTFTSGLFVAQVMWAIGVSMLVLSALIHLPRWGIAGVAVLMIAGHNLLDGIRAESFGSAAWIWNILHQPAMLEITPHVKLLVIYPILPWPGVMALGYLLGPLFKKPQGVRRTALLWLGLSLLVGFVALRSTNFYGDPAAWSPQGDWLGTALSFIDCEKYPASLLFLMMTLGPAMLLLAWFETADGALVRWITTYGRVSFLFYATHLPLIHALAVAFAWFSLGDAAWMFGSFVPPKPPGYGLSLYGVYAVWIGVLLALYPLCGWFADLKKRRHDWWLSYL